MKLVLRFDSRLKRHLPLLFALLLVVVLRLPTFLEPYWYGDEAIYLTLGVAMRHGEKLYAQIIDHKTPLIYYLAMVPSQAWFRALLTGWMLVTTSAFYFLTQKILPKQPRLRFFSTLLFVILTSMSWFEGTLPNGELFVMGFILVGGILLFDTPLGLQFLTNDGSNKKTSQLTINSIWRYLGAGVLFGLAVLTKVPAIFDAAAFLAIGWMLFADSFLAAPAKMSIWFKTLARVIGQLGVVLIGLLGTILASVIYFVARGSGQEYLDYGLLYNFRYVQSWGLPFDNPLLIFAFSLPGKLLLATGLVLLITLLGKKLSAGAKFASIWFVLALFASLLSNRPYPHYFLQIMPALCLLLPISVGSLERFFATKKQTHLTLVVISVGLLSLTVWVLLTLGFGVYPAYKYYLPSWQYAVGAISKDQYYSGFDPLVPDTYEASKLIRQSDNPYLFIWGTNPMLYALSQKVPTGRFTVSFHIHDFKAYQETMDAVREKQPQFIVVMKNETRELEGLNQYLSDNYIMNKGFDHFELWKKK